LRSLNQRTPTLIGSAFLGMKHLLMDEEFSENLKEVTLPMYASTNLKNHDLKMSEIIGDLKCAFFLVHLDPSGAGALSQKKSDECCVIESFEAEKEDFTTANDILAEKGGVLGSRVDFSARKLPVIPEKSKPPPTPKKAASSGLVQPCAKANEGRAEEAGQSVEAKNVPQKKVLSSRPKQFPTASPTLLCLLRVSEGRNLGNSSSALTATPSSDKKYCRNCNCDSLQESSRYFLSCRMFSPKNVITSELREAVVDEESRDNDAVINFDLQHSLPFSTDPVFLREYCQENHLVLEVWNRVTTKKTGVRKKKDKSPGGGTSNFPGKDGDDEETSTDNLVGLATVPLDKIFTAFQDEEKLMKAREMELPVIAANQWIPVYNLASSSNSHGSAATDDRGELRVLLAAGFEPQIYKLAVALDLSPPPTTATLTSHRTIGTSRQDNKENNDVTNINHADVTKQQMSCAVREEQPVVSNAHGFPLIRLVVSVEEGRNLPRIRTGDVCRDSPNSYVTLPPSYNAVALSDALARPATPKASPPTSRVVPNDCHPRWKMTATVNCPTGLLTDAKRHLIVKVWHKHSGHSALEDHVIGFGAIDLSPLLLKDFPSLCGWYNIIDFVGKVRGQIKVEITPEKTRENLNLMSELRQTHGRQDQSCSTTNDYDDVATEEVENVVGSSSYRIDCRTNSDNNLSDKCPTPPEVVQRWVLPDELDGQPSSSTYQRDTQSFLAAKLSDLDDLSDKLRQKLSSEEVIPACVEKEQKEEHESPLLEEFTLAQIQRTINNQLNAMKSHLIGQATPKEAPKEAPKEVPKEAPDAMDNGAAKEGASRRSSGESGSRMEPDGGNPSTASN